MAEQEEFKDFDDVNIDPQKPEAEAMSNELNQESIFHQAKKEEPSSFVTPKEPDKKPETRNIDNLSVWEELDSNNDVVKKYIFYISKDYIPLLDSMPTDKRSTYINDAISKKIDIENKRKQTINKVMIFVQIAIFIIVFIALSPLALDIANKAILATFDNYRYSQDNFEKLYKSHFEKSKAYTRSVEYNKKHQGK